MRVSKAGLAGALAIGMAVAAPSRVHANVTIGDFETGVDGWGTDGGPGSPTYASVTYPAGSNDTNAADNPVTSGTHALKSTESSGGFWGPSTGNLWTTAGASALEAATALKYDLTLNQADLFTGANTPSYAQSNEISWSIYGTGGSLGTNVVNNFGQMSLSSVNATDTAQPTAQGQWNGVNGVRTITVPLGSWTVTDPTTSTTDTYAQIFAAHPDVAWDVKFNFVEQVGTTGTAAPASMFFDNVQLVTPATPEPASLGLLALAVPAMMARRRRA